MLKNNNPHELKSGNITSFGIFIPENFRISECKFYLVTVEDSSMDVNKEIYCFADKTKKLFIHAFEIHASSSLPRVYPYHLRKFDDILFESKILRYIHENGFSIGDYNNAIRFFTKLNKVIQEMVKRAIKRALENSRKTVLPYDI